MLPPACAVYPLESMEWTHTDNTHAVTVDAAESLPQKEALVKVVYSLCPPASFYGTVRLTDDSRFTMNNDFRSDSRNPVWNDALQLFKNVPISKNLCLIFEVYTCIRYSDSMSNMAALGFAVLPLLRFEKYLNSGCFQIPIFYGAVPKEFVDQLKTSTDKTVVEIVEDNIAAKKLKFLSFSSLFVRAEDCQLEGDFATPLVCFLFLYLRACVRACVLMQN